MTSPDDQVREAVARLLCRMEAPDLDTDAFENFSAPNWTRYMVTAQGVIATLREMGWGDVAKLQVKLTRERAGWDESVKVHSRSWMVLAAERDALKAQMEAITSDAAVEAAYSRIAVYGINKPSVKIAMTAAVDKAKEA